MTVKTKRKHTTVTKKRIYEKYGNTDLFSKINSAYQTITLKRENLMVEKKRLKTRIDQEEKKDHIPYQKNKINEIRKTLKELSKCEPLLTAEQDIKTMSKQLKELKGKRDELRKTHTFKLKDGHKTTYQQLREKEKKRLKDIDAIHECDPELEHLKERLNEINHQLSEFPTLLTQFAVENHLEESDGDHDHDMPTVSVSASDSGEEEDNCSSDAMVTM